MIAHERRRMSLSNVVCKNLAEPGEKRLMVVPGDKHGISPVGAGHHMVKQARVLESRLSVRAQGWSVPLIPPRILLICEQ